MTNDDDEYEADDDDQEEEEGEENEEEDEGEGCKDGGDEGEVHVEGWRATSRKKDAGGRWTPPCSRASRHALPDRPAFGISLGQLLARPASR